VKKKLTGDRMTPREAGYMVAMVMRAAGLTEVRVPHAAICAPYIALTTYEDANGLVFSIPDTEATP
jgi:hypothetical protein